MAHSRNFQIDPESVRARVAHIAAHPHEWRVVGGHAPYGLYLRHLPPDTRYLTILRDPVDRVISQHHFGANVRDRPRGPVDLRAIWQQLLELERTEGGRPGEEAIVLPEDTDVSLEEGLRLRVPIYENLMTRFLWGGESLFGDLPADAVDRAKQNLERFWFVGIRERLDDAIILLGRRLGIGLMPNHLQHVNEARPGLEETPAELRQLIADHNVLDAELYRFARERFEQEAPPPEELADEVEELRRLRVPLAEEGQARERGKRAVWAAKRAAREARVGEGATKKNDGSARADVAAGQPLLAFVHIPRTGGGTLSAAISKNYSRLRGAGNYQASPEKTRARLESIASAAGLWQAVGDHVPYGLYLRYLPQDARYITILRDPVDRVLSHYHFHAQKGDEPGSGGARKLRTVWQEFAELERREAGGEGEPIVLPADTEFSLEEGLRLNIPIYTNFMTRFLWGGESLFGALPPDAAERAKKNLESFWFIGVRERLDDSIVLLGRMLGIGLMPYHLRHVSTRRPTVAETSDELRRLVAEHNALDLELYEFARRRFEETAPAPEELAEEVEELRHLSVPVTAAGEADKATRKDRQAAKRQAHEAREQERSALRADKQGAREARDQQRSALKAARAARPRKERGADAPTPSASLTPLVGETATQEGKDSARADAAADQPLLAFVHIPRTGGGTLSTAISKNYSPQKGPGNFQKSPEKTRAGLENIVSKGGFWQAVGDHVPYGLYLRYLPPDTRYLTILREPVDRVLSHYHFHAQAGDPPGSGGARKLRNIWQELTKHGRIEAGEGDEAVVLPEDTEFSLEEGLRLDIPIYNNFMTRFLWGGESLFGELPPDAAERAKKNIEGFFFVGLRERLDESIILLGRQLGAGLMPYHLRHVSAKRPPLAETSDELRALVAEHNAFDLELYEFARQRFEETAPPPEELAEEVEELRRRSAEVTEAGDAARAAKKEAGKARRRAERTVKSGQRAEEREQNKGQKRETRAARAAAAKEAGEEAPARNKKPRTKNKAGKRQSDEAGAADNGQPDEAGAADGETGSG
jgi:hypothetical protein